MIFLNFKSRLRAAFLCATDIRHFRARHETDMAGLVDDVRARGVERKWDIAAGPVR
jgi:hypothetical protein